MLRSRRSAMSKVASTSTAAAAAAVALAPQVPSPTYSASSQNGAKENNNDTKKNELCCSTREDNEDGTDVIRYLQMRKISNEKKIIWIGLVVSLYCFVSSIRFYKLLIHNMTIPSNIHQYNNSLLFSTTTASSLSSSSSYYRLRSKNINSNKNNTTIVIDYYEYGYDKDYPYCPRLPPRLEGYVENIKSQPFQLLSKDDFTRQLPFMEQPENQGTTGNTIKVCPKRFVHGYIPCLGVSKTYKSVSVYEHVKFCLTELETTGITPRILHTDDETLTIVEEDLGHVTMMNSKIPLDFALQIQRIRCILLSNHIIHRDITWRNFIVDMKQGYISIIDFGDAFVWRSNNNNNKESKNGGQEDGQNDKIVYTYRNIVNLFNMWWKSYDEESIMSNLISLTEKQLKGKRIWEPEHRWTSMNQNKLGRSIVLQSQQQQQIQQSNNKNDESSPILEDIAPPEVLQNVHRFKQIKSN